MAELIFRDAALERLSTSEQLDRLVRVSRPLGWLALAAFFAACLLALVWSAFVLLRRAVQTPNVLQMEMVECGTASRAMGLGLEHQASCPKSRRWRYGDSDSHGNQVEEGPESKARSPAHWEVQARWPPIRRYLRDSRWVSALPV